MAAKVHGLQELSIDVEINNLGWSILLSDGLFAMFCAFWNCFSSLCKRPTVLFAFALANNKTIALKIAVN